MQKIADQSGIEAVLKKIGRGGNGLKVLESFLEKSLGPSRPQNELPDDLVRFFLLIRDASKHGAHPKLPAAHLAGLFAKIAEKSGIPPERFYSALLDGIMAEEESEEGPRRHAKVPTHERILEAALEVFSQKGFHTATMDEISERAGVGKGTLYRYFETKENLFDELVRIRLEELERKAESILDGQDDVLTMIAKYIRAYFEFFDRNQLLYRLIVHERADMGEHSRDVYLKKVMRAIPHLKRKVFDASQQGILKDVDFQTVFYGTMGFVHGVIEKWVARDCSYPLVGEVPGVLEVLFYGFVKTKQG